MKPISSTDPFPTAQTYPPGGNTPALAESGDVLRRKVTRAKGLVSTVALPLIVVVGVALRIATYVANRSFSIDESLLALNVITKSPTQLLGHLFGVQAAPVGFLGLQKFMEMLFGSSEFSLRLLPLIASLASLGLFVVVSRSFLSRRPALYALALFALFDPVISYAAIAKQYEFDVLVTLILYALFVRVEQEPRSWARLASLGFAGVVAVWFSHPAVFVLATVGVVVAVRLAPQDRRKVAALGAFCALWVASLAGEIALTGSNVQTIARSFQRGEHHSSILLTTGADPGAGWFADATSRLRYLVGLEHTTTGVPVLGSVLWLNQALTVVLVSVAFLGGVGFLVRRTRIGILLTLPVLLVLVASALHRYPLVGRTLLFLFPAIALCMAEGVNTLSRFRRRTVARALAGGAACTVLVAVALLPAFYLTHTRNAEEMKPALAYLGRHYHPTDTLYVNTGAQIGLAYYHLCGCAPFDPAKVWPFSAGQHGNLIGSRSPRLHIVTGNFGRTERESDIAEVSGRQRVWFLLTALNQTTFRHTLRRIKASGRILDMYEGEGVSGHAILLLSDMKR
jgi:uncharacterized membrane protein